jgi:integrase
VSLGVGQFIVTIVISLYRKQPFAVTEPEQTYRVLELLEQMEYLLLLLIAATGLRISEALCLRWMDILWAKGEIEIRRTCVHNVMQDGAKTRLSKPLV